MNDERKRLLAKVAYLHFIEGKSQTKIAADLGIYRTTISRMITRAKEEQIVTIAINDYDTNIFSLEDFIQTKYNLKRVEIVDDLVFKTEDAIQEALAKRSAELVRQLVQENDVVGISWGSTLSKMVNALEPKAGKKGTICPLAGGPSNINTKFHVNTLVYEMSRILQGRGVYINTSVVQETKEEASTIISTQRLQELTDLWDKLDLAIVGIGGTLEDNASQWRDLLTPLDYQRLSQEQAVGEVCCRFFDQEGNVVYHDLQNRTIGLTLSQLKKVPKSVAVAYGENKANAMLAIIKKKYVNHLVTDRKTILKVLELECAN